MVFVMRQDKPTAGFSVGVILNRKETKGDVGLEVEIEGYHLPTQVGNGMTWGVHQDGSLRAPKGSGGGAYEYVLLRPLAFDKTEKAINDLWAKFKENNTKIVESNRSSVHVHLNVQSFHFTRLTSFMAMYFTLEEILTEWCGDHRVGNLFCMRAKDAPAIITQIRRFIQTDGGTPLHEHHHYAALNSHALSKFGSLEFRTLRGVSDPEIIIDWVSILERLHVLSGEFPDPRDVCAMFSREGPSAFFDNILGDKAGIVRKGIPFDEAQIRDSLYEGIRMAQDLCYCRDWAMVKPVEIKSDPFGRDVRKIIKRFGTLNSLDIEGALDSLSQTAQPQIVFNHGPFQQTTAHHGPAEEEDEDNTGPLQEVQWTAAPPQPTQAAVIGNTIATAQASFAQLAHQQALAQQAADANNPWWINEAGGEA